MADSERRFVSLVEEDAGMRVKRWAFDVGAIAVAAGVSEGTVRAAIKAGTLDPGKLRSVACWVASWELRRMR